MQNSLHEYDLVIENAVIHTMDIHMTVLSHMNIGIKKDKIACIQKVPLLGKQVIDAKGKMLTPGFIDCHTHLVYAGHRAHEFSQRLSGMSYAEIAKQGGGIQNTVSACQMATEAELYRQSRWRLNSMMNHGCTTVEIKSGYGLDLESELKLLKMIKKLGQEGEVDIIATYLGLHALPQAYKDNPDAYVSYVINTILPELKAKDLCLGVDAFCEDIAFHHHQIAPFFKAARDYGFALHLHAEQLTYQGGANFAATYHASSVDHLEYLPPQDVPKLKKSGTVAVLLPGAFYQLQETQKPPIQSLRKHGVPMAIATDCNPGTSPFTSLPLMMNMACILFGLTINEAWLGVTRYAAMALHLEHCLGTIEVGKQANLVLWQVAELEDVIYMPTMNYVEKVIYKGRIRPLNHFS